MNKLLLTALSALIQKRYVDGKRVDPTKPYNADDPPYNPDDTKEKNP